MIRKCYQIILISKLNCTNLQIHEIFEIFLSFLRHCFLIEFKSKFRLIIKKCITFVQQFRNLHIVRSFHMIFIYLIKIVKQNERISTL